MSAPLAFGTSAVGCGIGFSFWGLVLAIMGVLAACIAFVAIAATRVLVWPPEKLAVQANKTLLWARIQRAYFVSSLIFWPIVLARLVVLLLQYVESGSFDAWLLA